MNYGEVQGPINKEPEEKLETGNKQDQPSGIRRLYVIDYSNFVTIVIHLPLDIKCFLPPQLFYFKYFYLCEDKKTKCSELINENNLAIFQISDFVKPCENRENHVISFDEKKHCSLINSNKNKFISLKFGFVVFCLNLLYILICVYMNQIVALFFFLSFSIAKIIFYLPIKQIESNRNHIVIIVISVCILHLFFPNTRKFYFAKFVCFLLSDM